MADLAVLNSIYNQINTTYSPMRSNTKYDTHKKSELRGVYNSIVEKSKDSPLFLLDDSEATKNYVIDLKENSRSLKNTIASLSHSDEEDLLSKKTVSSSDETKVLAGYIGNKKAEEEVGEFSLSVKQLASRQENTGNFLSPDEKIPLEADTYSFDLHSKDTDYEFQFNIGENDSNKTIQDKLQKLITRAQIGISAELVYDEEGRTALKLSSEETGTRKDSELQFSISDNKTSKASGIVDYLGMSNISAPPQNAVFTLNGNEKSASGNHFTVDDILDLTLVAPTAEGEEVNIGFKTDVESLIDNVNKLLEGYNGFIDNTSRYAEQQPYSKTLVNEMKSLTTRFSKGLEDLGINLSTDAKLSFNTEKFKSALLEDESSTDKLSAIKDFADSILKKTSEIALDPMQYTNRKIVEYKNPGHNFSAPYVTSNYSGMLFSGYC
ncbi:MAG: flagellar filament capping protein FliD [Lachnospiraceae bacterium]|nr:flagellar filament capping protein FliD [Lachnospiraceae bacterium]